MEDKGSVCISFQAAKTCFSIERGLPMFCGLVRRSVSGDLLAHAFFHGWRNGIRAKFGDNRCRKRRDAAVPLMLR